MNDVIICPRCFNSGCFDADFTTPQVILVCQECGYEKLLTDQEISEYLDE